MGDDRGIDSGSDDATPDDPPKAAGRRFRVRPVIAPRRDDDDSDRVESADETEIGWGDQAGRRDGDWYRRERPPHHE